MAVEIGQVLDKYELLEEVGQGGMAVVYRGLDRSLRREVAIKILHRHLADNPESRERFQREARAVAKLHHRNILEIFDFSGLESPESYIVTEFIAGQTLAEFIAGYDIKFPEVGALIITEVCEALRHAHSHGVLHRDIKPENIMVRTDGVVKLMDFGIAQVIDSQRMTLTGQLLGSPAYMSPEHILGKPLDFRTDVFSMGILLYQLCTGALPFHGQNPHEILNRIAECKYSPPDRTNALIGGQLCRIIDKAMAREKADRYRDVTEFLEALSNYLAGSGLDDLRAETTRFFGAPASYELALKQRLIQTLTQVGENNLRSDPPAALEALNRVATIDPENQQVAEALRKLETRQRSRNVLGYASAAVAILGIAVGVNSMWPQPPMASPAIAFKPSLSADAGPSEADTFTSFATLTDASTPETDAASAADTSPRRVLATHRPRTRERRGLPQPTLRPTTRPPAMVSLRVFPPNSEFKLGSGPWTPISGRSTSIATPAKDTTVQLRNATCCQSVSRTIGPSAAKPLSITLPYLPSAITPICATPDVSVQIDGRVARVGQARTITFGDSLSGQHTVSVVFFDEIRRRTDKHTLSIRFNQRREVQCQL